MEKDIYNDIVDEFVTYFPQIAKDVVTWHASGRREITVKLKNGDRVVFNDISKTIRRLPGPDAPEMSEDSWKTGFGRKLGYILASSNMSQTTLAIETGISQVMISRYISGNSQPSAYAVTKIARALNCSIDELTDFE